jgi:uncharacterized protein YbjT (DUF2867 family)
MAALPTGVAEMNVLIFGATGMVGQGVLRECLKADDVDAVVTIGRKATGARHAKLMEIVHADMFDYADIEPQLSGFDACFFCLGVSSGGMTEADYARLTYDLTMAAADTLARLNPDMTFTYVSGAGTDSTEKGSTMWSRVKGRTENALMQLPFRGVFLFRPGIIQPLDGIRSQTASYRILYNITKPLLPVLRWLLPNTVLTTEVMGKAMLAAARIGEGRVVLETRDINALAAR